MIRGKTLTKDQIFLLCEKLKNVNGKFDGQRLSEKWLLSNGYVKEYDFLLKNDLLNTKSLYMYLYEESDKCRCGQPRRFVGFRDGFKEFCEACGRTRNNSMVKMKEKIDLLPEEVPGYVRQESGYSAARIKKLSERTIELIKERTSFLGHECGLSERIYNIEHGLTESTVCTVCCAPVPFRTSKIGYQGQCSVKCTMIANAPKNRRKTLRRLYKNYTEKHRSSEDYDVQMFSEEEYVSGAECFVKYTHKKCGHTFEHLKDYQGAWHCPKCFNVRSRKQTEVHEYILTLDECTRMNDRKIIAPKELDIVCPEHSVAFEYDDINFHSFGKSALSALNRLDIDSTHHVQKTELCETKGYQLFRIFSNEWVDPKKQLIWKSVISSALGKSERIYARKCKIGDVSPDEYRSFVEKNHLQGYVGANVKLGLYYEGELVQVVSFSKPRYDRGTEWEIMRICSKVGFTVVGGASRLLRYFERTYSPKSIVSYANRRWSQGRVYETLGFERCSVSVPGYFYFKPTTQKLESRTRYQKHKLEGLLPEFNPELTEQQNMIENGYRLIYDCGNIVYRKRY